MSISSSNSRFSSLQARPPTPPRDTSPQPDIDVELDKAIELLEDNFDIKQSSGTRSMDVTAQTLQFTPPSSGGDHISNSNKRRKRVEISGWSTYHNHPNASNLRALPRAGTPLKSILKASEPSPLVENTKNIAPAAAQSAHDFESVEKMLQAVIDQLAEEGRDARGDAYVVLQGALKHYEEVPGGVKALVERIPTLLGYIERDMGSEGVMNMTVVTQAIKFTVALLHIPQAANAMDDDFREFVVERAIAILADSNAPKAFTNHYLNLVGHQKFPSHIMTDKRVERLLEILNPIHDRVKGNSMVIVRLHVYRRLILQSPQSMASRLTPWLENVFHAMVSSIKEIRSRAIDVGLLAAKEFSSLKHTHIATSAILDHESKVGKSYINYIVARLTQMAAKQEEAFQVPQIWSIVVLLMKERPGHLDTWRHLKSWLRVFEKVLKNSEDNVRKQAVLAWNRFVYVVILRDGVSDSMANLLRKVISVWFQDDKTEKTTSNGRTHATMAYATLLYYSLRPGLPTQSHCHSWRNFVSEMAFPTDGEFGLDASVITQVLHRLLMRGQIKFWNEGKVFETPSSATLEDLPHLDSKWIRQNIALVLQPIRLCLNSGPWEPTINKSTSVKDMWLSFTQALAEAGVKEVTVSMELKDAIAHVTNMFHSFWNDYPESLSNHRRNGDMWMEKFGFLISSAMTSLGPLYFSERLLSRNGEADFEAAPTPSHRSRLQVSLHSPLLSLLESILRVGPDSIGDQSRLAVIQRMIATCLNSRNMKQAKVQLLRDCTSIMMPLAKGRPISQALWHYLADLTSTTLRSPPDGISVPGKSFAFIVEILSAGVDQDDVQLQPAWEDLYEAFSETVARDSGDAGVTIAVSEPMSALAPNKSSLTRVTFLHMATMILKYNRHPKSQRALRQSHEALGTSSSHLHRNSDFDPYHSVYTMVHLALVLAYNSLDSINKKTVQSVIHELRKAIETCPQSLAGLFLRKNQDSLSVWIQDKDRRLVNSSADSRDIVNEVIALWRTVILTFRALPQKNTATLAALDILLIAGFSSSRREIVNATVEFWNDTFGKQDTLAYPSPLVPVIERLRRVLDIEVPSFPDISADEDIVPLSFLDSQDDSLMSSPVSPNKKNRNLAVTRSPAFSRHSPKVSPMRTHSRTPVRKASKGRLRHEDSQLQFAAIDSSPLGGNDASSQLLTENQKEVLAKQRQEAAMMFPDISTAISIPLSEASPDNSRLNILPRNRPKRVVNTPPARKETPTAKLEAQVFVGSSPTPVPGQRSRSTSSGRQRRMATELPSSPPKSPVPRISKLVLHSSSDFAQDRFMHRSHNHKEREDMIDIGENDSTLEAHGLAPFEDEEADLPDGEFDQGLDDTMPDVTSSDADILLNAQINNEITSRKERQSPQPPVPTTFSDVFVDAPTECLEHNDIDEAEFVDASPELDTAVVAEEVTIRRENESSVPLAFKAEAETETDEERLSQIEDSFAAPSSSQVEDASASSTRASRKRKSGEGVINTAASKRPKRGQGTGLANDSQSSQTQRRRGPGRPRKQMTELTSSQLEAALDLTSDGSSEVPSQPPSVVESTASESRRLSHVQVTPQHEKTRKRSSDQALGHVEVEANSAASSSQRQRPILRPKSIIDRLKSMLTDLKSYAFGSMEEYHEADSLMAAIRREGFRASERGEQDLE
ncbi:hypothetical protein EJ05DRAFT_498292 [Pseudovirgaria hyperparasitica]|uniref:Telomere-associated protein Rif1 N-terminal domain-containing protein n=1 Tax=Pseudovirgaria hyperparasitica TaxID=470096 RepID=A0A6A6WC96_9PEZI|nr:uncharacterized protein EJ05DRAFT_498292 [Pseudovirgaria hyperparasitica]KAF2760333.1 hypothetical protein EJ05DRAFT_498292 [Pseudovirgaria hyperparasitica]